MTEPGAASTRSAPADRNRPLWPWFVALALVAALVGAAVAWVATGVQRTPANDSADAGFARDMGVHHSQAVEMAWSIVGRTQNPEIRAIATDIVLSQQAQVGMMQGWLDAWGLPFSGAGPQMAWMGHPTDGPMPGMATPAEVASLQTLPLAEADRQFLELMIRHHQGGIEMAGGGLEFTTRPEVRRLAQAILTSQQYEIDAMEDLLDRPKAAATPVALPGNS